MTYSAWNEDYKEDEYSLDDFPEYEVDCPGCVRGCSIQDDRCEWCGFEFKLDC